MGIILSHITNTPLIHKVAFSSHRSSVAEIRLLLTKLRCSSLSAKLRLLSLTIKWRTLDACVAKLLLYASKIIILWSIYVSLGVLRNISRLLI